jgi:hypothetical protein
MMTQHRLMQLICAVALVALLPKRPDVAEPFRDYYNRHQGIRVLGYPLTELAEANGYPAQYFGKGRIEDHRADLFPGGWPHDIGLPMSDTFTAVTSKQGEQRTIFMQAFERTVLTYDMRNPATWQVERANIGADALRTLPQTESPIEIPAMRAQVTLPSHYW